MPKHISWIVICPLDILQELAGFSKLVQKQVSLLVGHYGVRKNLLENLNYLKDNTGRRVSQFLAESTCDYEPCSLENYYTASTVMWNEVALTKVVARTNKVPEIIDFRDKFVPAIIEEFRTYFPPGQYDDYKVFDPHYWPSDFVEARDYGHESIRRLSTTLGMDAVEVESCVDEWSSLLPELKEKYDVFCQMKRLEILDFWEAAMSQENPVVDWLLYRTIRQLIAKVLVIPIGSSECERGFSIMNHIRTKRRARLSEETIDALMRIR